MDIPRISGFPKEERFEIEEDTLRRILSKLLSEFNLQQKSMEKTYEGDYIVTSYHRILNKDVKTLVRVSSHHIGLEREDIEDLQEDMLQVGAISGIFITPAYFTKDAQKYAKHLPIRLVNGTELLEFVEEYKLEVKGAFLTGVDDQTIVNYFKGRRRTKFFGLVDAGERIVEIDKRYLPLAHFRFRKSADRTEVINNLYVDLHNCYVLYLEEADIERNDFIKRIMDLPKESRDIFVDLLKHGELKHEYIKGKHLNILEKQGLVMKTEKGGMRAVDVILDEVSDTISIATSEATTMGKAKPIERERVIKAVDNVRAVVHKHKPEIDRSFDLVHFIEFSTEIDRSFDPDSIKYPVNEIDKILVNCYKDADISYEGNVYLPYYRCKYVDVNDNERFDEVIAPEFKPFMPRPDEYYKFYRLIDKFPAVPFLVPGFAYLLLNLGKLDKVMHIFSTGFIFLFISVIFGIALKLIFRTERKIPRYTGTIAKYGFPSMHSLTAIGGITFAFFINPYLGLLLVPLGLLYMYSRIAIGVHSDIDVIGGAIIGILLGFFSGFYIMKNLYLLPEVELFFSVLFFIVPILMTVIGLKMRKW